MVENPLYRGVEHDSLQVERVNGLKCDFLHAFLGQAAEAAADGVELTEAFGQAGPEGQGVTGIIIEKQIVVFGRYSVIYSFARQQGPIAGR